MGTRNHVQGKASCEVCGKSGGQYFEVHLGGERHIFDSFECAIGGLMPRCSVCGGIILGPGVQDNNASSCSYLCSNLSSVRDYEPRMLLREPANA